MTHWDTIVHERDDLRAEVERLTKEAWETFEANGELAKLVMDLRAEVERLREQIALLQVEIERLRAWAVDEQRGRHKAEEDRMNARSETEQLRAAARAFDECLSADCDRPARDVLRAALEPKP